MPSAPSTRLSTLRVAWCHLGVRWDSSIGAALALLLALLPAGLVLVDRSGARSDLRTVIAASGGLAVQKAGVADTQAFDAFQRQAQSLVAPRLGQYVDGGSARGVAGPYRIISIGSQAPATPAASGDVAVTYVGDLQSRVDVVQGIFPKPGTSGGEAMGTMPVPVADRIGAQLFDIVCVSPAAAGPAGAPAPWCVRLVGLWRPGPGADPAWTGQTAPVQIFTDHDDFFALTGHGGQRVQAVRAYTPQAGALTPQNAGAVAQRVRDVRSAAGGTGQVTTTLDSALAHYASTSVTSFPVELLAAALVPLLTLLAVVMARWYVEPRLHELALLRARGWSRRRVRRLVLVELALLAGPAVVVAVAGLLAVLWQATDGAIGARPAALSGGELLAIAVAAAVLVVAAARFSDLARWASQQSVLRLDTGAGSLAGRGGAGGSLLVVPAALLLAVPRLAGALGWRLPGPLDDLGALVTAVAGLVLLVLAALPLLSLLTGPVGGRRGGLEGPIANVHLRHWWQRTAAPGFLVVLAFAIGSYAAVALVDQLLGGPGGALGLAIAISLSIGLAAALATALLTYGLVFLVACRARADYYAALLVDGLPATTVRRSVEIEQQAVLVLGLAAGLAIGLVLLAATASGIGLGGQAGALAAPPQPAAVIAGVGATAGLGLIGGLVIAGMVRRGVGFRLVEQGWRAT